MKERSRGREIYFGREKTSRETRRTGDEEERFDGKNGGSLVKYESLEFVDDREYMSAEYRRH